MLKIMWKRLFGSITQRLVNQAVFVHCSLDDITVSTVEVPCERLVENDAIFLSSAAPTKLPRAPMGIDEMSKAGKISTRVRSTPGQPNGSVEATNANSDRVSGMETSPSLAPPALMACSPSLICLLISTPSHGSRSDVSNVRPEIPDRASGEKSGMPGPSRSDSVLKLFVRNRGECCGVACREGPCAAIAAEPADRKSSFTSATSRPTSCWLTDSSSSLASTRVCAMRNAISSSKTRSVSKRPAASSSGPRRG
mmetsp:Transcript_6973/g.19733  ORF Transcript_6973/g.19733 Transcript_6973/m.19733 type:complete len:253 (-) Transcript_6973:97-855(-)